VAEGQTRPT